MRDLTPEGLDLSAPWAQREGGHSSHKARFYRTVLPVWLACVAASACGGDDNSGQQGGTTSNTTTGSPAAAGSSAAPTTATKPSTATTTTTTTPASSTPAAPSGANGSAAPGGAPSTAMGGAAPAAGNTPPVSGAMMANMAMGMAPPPARPTTPAGPKDGDPSKPMVEIPGIKCGAPQISFAAAPPTTSIGGKDVFVGYPCKHEGAPVTFFLFVHGTVQEEQKIPFTLGTYSVHELIDSHNLIVVAPKAVGTQWGNGDMGVDLPHLHEVVDWTYATFKDKFDIRSMWAHGGSWGAFYLSTFACDDMLKDRLNGVYMVVGGGCPRCSDRLSCVVIQQEQEKAGMGMTLTPEMKETLVDQAMIAPYATMHGCQGKMGPTPLNADTIWNFPNCSKGWYHAYILGPGQHADKLDQNTVIELTNQMKMTEQ